MEDALESSRCPQPELSACPSNHPWNIMALPSTRMYIPLVALQWFRGTSPRTSKHSWTRRKV